MPETADRNWADAARVALNGAMSHEDGSPAQGTSAQVAIAFALMAIYERLHDIDMAIQYVG